MPARHSAHTFGTARAVLSAAVALLVLVVVWVAVRAVGPTQERPTLVLPAPVASPSASSPAPAPPTARAAPRRTAPSPSPVRSKPRPKPSRTTTPPAPRAEAAATLRVFSDWDRGYAAGVRVTNTGSAPLTWRVTVTHPHPVRPVGVYGATVTHDRTTLVFRGGPLAPGATADFGYQATGRGPEGRGPGTVRPAGCSVVGGACAVR